MDDMIETVDDIVALLPRGIGEQFNYAKLFADMISSMTSAEIYSGLREHIDREDAISVTEMLVEHSFDCVQAEYERVDLSWRLCDGRIGGEA